MKDKVLKFEFLLDNLSLQSITDFDVKIDILPSMYTLSVELDFIKRFDEIAKNI